MNREGSKAQGRTKSLVFPCELRVFVVQEIREMEPIHLTEIAKKWLDSFNRHDVEGILALYSDQAEHYSPKLKVRQPGTKGLIKGKDALRSWWKDSFDRLPSLQYEIIQLTPFDNRVFMEYLRHVEGEDYLRVGEMLIVDEGLIVASRVYHS